MNHELIKNILIIILTIFIVANIILIYLICKLQNKLEYQEINECSNV